MSKDNRADKSQGEPAATGTADQGEVVALRAQVARQQALLEQQQGEIQELRAERDNVLEQLRAAAELAAGPRDKALPQAKPGHVWAYTKYPYTVEAWEGGKFTPQVVAAGEPVQVSHKELEIDKLRRYPHLEDVAAREQRLAAARERKLGPAKEFADNLAAQFASANEMVRAREQHRKEAAAMLLNPERLAQQLPL